MDYLFLIRTVQYAVFDILRYARASYINVICRTQSLDFRFPDKLETKFAGVTDVTALSFPLS